MAKLYISRKPDGTYTLRALRLAGKELAAQKSISKIPHQGIGAAAKLLIEEVAPRKISRPVI